MNARVNIGIDPDLDKSGFAAVCYGEYTDITSFNLWDLYGSLLSLFPVEAMKNPDLVMVWIEDSRLSKGTWHKNGQSNAGKGKAVCKLIADFCASNNIPHTCIKPAGYSKMFDDVNVFKSATGWTEKTNKDARAAAAIVYKFYKGNNGKAKGN